MGYCKWRIKREGWAVFAIFVTKWLMLLYMALHSKHQLQHVGFFLTPSNSPYSPGLNTGVSSLFLLQEIFPTQGLNPGLPHCRQIPYQLSHKGSPSVLEWVAYLFSSRSSQPRNRTRVSCIVGRFFTSWAMREAQFSHNSTWFWHCLR